MDVAAPLGELDTRDVDEPRADSPFWVTVWVRKTVEFLRRNDTPGGDLQHHMMGYVAGLAARSAWVLSRLL